MGKKLAKAPVYFAIMQVRYNPVLALDSFVPTIQEKLRSQFPDFQKMSIAVLNLNIGAPVESATPPPVGQLTRYTFSNIARNAGFLLDQGALSFQTTEYGVFEQFSESFLEGLKVVHSAVNLSYFERIGIRYLDAVHPASGEALTDYLDKSVHGLVNKLDRQLVHAFSETRTQRDGTNLISRAIIRDQDGDVAFPDDLQPVWLGLPDRFKNKKGRHAILDTDCWHEGRESFSLEAVKSNLNVLHEEIGKSFKMMVTQQALERWK